MPSEDSGFIVVVVGVELESQDSHALEAVLRCFTYSITTSWLKHDAASIPAELDRPNILLSHIYIIIIYLFYIIFYCILFYSIKPLLETKRVHDE